MASDLTQQLYREIDNADQPREINHWHASSIGKCPRALYYERKKVAPLPENEPGAGKKLRWRGGHAVEEAIRPTLEAIYPNLQTNKRFTSEKLDLTGEFDGYDPDSRSLISVKSVHDFAFTAIDGKTGLKEKKGMKMGRNGREVTDWGHKQKAYPHHQWQEHAYVPLLKEADMEVEHTIYIYITLGGLIDTFREPVSPLILKRVLDKVEYLNKCWRDSTLPVCLCQPGQEMYDVTDQYCPYKTVTGCCSESLL